MHKSFHKNCPGKENNEKRNHYKAHQPYDCPSNTKKPSAILQDSDIDKLYNGNSLNSEALLNYIDANHSNKTFGTIE